MLTERQVNLKIDPRKDMPYMAFQHLRIGSTPSAWFNLNSEYIYAHSDRAQHELLITLFT